MAQRMKRENKIILILLIIFIGFFLSISLPIIIDKINVHSYRKNASLIKFGVDKTEVQHILGKPTSRFRKGSGLFDGKYFLFERVPLSPERWAYGSVFDFNDCFQKEFPYFFPLRIRLFGPDSDDISIEFDDNGKVTKVIIPDIK